MSAQCRMAVEPISDRLVESVDQGIVRASAFGFERAARLVDAAAHQPSTSGPLPPSPRGTPWLTQAGFALCPATPGWIEYSRAGAWLRFRRHRLHLRQPGPEHPK